MLISVSSLNAATVKFNLIGKGGAGLLPTNETTPTAGIPGRGGLIGAGITFDDVTKLLTLNVGWGSDRGFINLSGSAVAAHIHGPTSSNFPASYQETAGVMMSVDKAPFTFVSGAGAGSITGTSAALNATQEAALMAGKLYLNVHTSKTSGGEIRGNLVPVTETVPASIVVLNNASSGAGSLRQAVIDATTTVGADTITFDPHAFTGGENNTILLTKLASSTGSIIISDSGGVIIDASGLSTGLTIDGGLSKFTLFFVGSSSSLTLRSLTLARGDGSSIMHGGGIHVEIGGILVVERCTLRDNVTSGDGGAISNSGTATLKQCTLCNNKARSGGAIFNFGTSTLINCTVSNNSSTTFAGGIYNWFLNTLNLTNTVVSGNIANTDNLANVVSDDIDNGKDLNLSGVNFIGKGIIGGGITTGPAPLTGDAMLYPLANNGGPTQTMMPRPGSPCIDPIGGATSSSFTTDQRGTGFASLVDGDQTAGAILDIGAVEAPPFSSASSIAFSTAARSFYEDAGTVQVTITRTGYVGATASVQVSSAPGSATLADYVAVNDTVNFAANEVSKILNVTLIADPAVAEANEKFMLSLSNATGASTTLGTPATCTINIIDAMDKRAPTVTVTTPTNNAVMLNNYSPLISVTGTATDNQGLSAVEVSLDGGAYVSAPLAIDSTGKKGTFSHMVNLGNTPNSSLGGTHKIAVRSVDTVGNRSSVATRSIIFRLVRPLTVSINNDAFGSVTTGFVPSSNRNIGELCTITATPKPGCVFSGWTANNFFIGTGVTELAAELPTLTFTMLEGMSLQANFIANPFIPGMIGTFNGLVQLARAPFQLDTMGMLQNAKVMSNGSFTSMLKIDGQSIPVSGIFNADGHARFMAGGVRTSELTIPRIGKLSLVVSLDLGLGGITGTVKQRSQGITIANSNISAQRALYSATSKVPEPLAGTTSKPYTLILPARVVSSELNSYYPRGTGYATMTVNINGTVTYTGKLADHTPISGSVALVTGNQWPIFVSLYKSKGCIVGNAVITDADSTTYDVTSTGLYWVRPIQKVQWYPDGWPTGLVVDLVGARYVVPPATSVLPDLQAISPNLTLTFNKGFLSSPLNFDQTVSTTNMVSNVPIGIVSPTMTITKATGLVTGKFPHTDGTLPTYQGVILQKGALKGVRGYFMTTSPKVINGLGESGVMTAIPK